MNHDLSQLSSGEIPPWHLVIDQFRLPEPTDYGASHWIKVLRNGMQLCHHHPADEEIVGIFALFHDSCRHDARRAKDNFESASLAIAEFTGQPNAKTWRNFFPSSRESHADCIELQERRFGCIHTIKPSRNADESVILSTLRFD
jgi:HD superfamily phosphodiesterase